jgi:hypothetical protein
LARPPRPPNTIIPGLSCTSLPPPVIDGIIRTRPLYERTVGIDCISSLSSVRWRRALCRSTTGVSPVTVIVSCSEPTGMSAFTGTTKSLGTSTASRLMVLNPVSVKVTT